MEFLKYPVDGSIKTLGRRYAAPVLLELLNGNDRFNMLLKEIPGINPRSLSARLDELQKHGLVSRVRTGGTPGLVKYALTPKGEEMRGLLREIVSFSLRWHQ